MMGHGIAFQGPSQHVRPLVSTGPDASGVHLPAADHTVVSTDFQGEPWKGSIHLLETLEKPVRFLAPPSHNLGLFFSFSSF